MKRLIIISFCLFILFAYGLLLTQQRFHIMPDELQPLSPSGFYDYKGETNVHSRTNLGTGEFSSIIAAAQEAGLDWLYFTDLNTFDRNFQVEGYHGKLLAMQAAEYSYLDSRVLSYDIFNRNHAETLGQAQVLVADELSREGKDSAEDLLVLAHPFKPGYSWSGPYPPGLDGIEVINLKSVWQNAWINSKASFFWSALVFPFNAPLALTRLYDEPEEELRLWDKLNSKTRRMFGFAGVEATGKADLPWGGSVRLPSYETAFNLISNHVLLRSELTGEAESDKRKITRALADGNFYFSLDVLANPKGFIAYIVDHDKIEPLGSKIKFHPGLHIFAHLPHKPDVPFETAFLKDGQALMSSNSQDTDFVIPGPGSYRLVVRVFITLTLPDGQRWMSWIYTNPFEVE